jgi:hypothetical protein
MVLLLAISAKSLMRGGKSLYSQNIAVSLANLACHLQSQYADLLDLDSQLQMAIIFTHADVPNLTTTWGTPGQVTYIGRLAMWDPRVGRRLDFTHLGDDLVYSRLWLPDDAPAVFGDIERFAIENDLAEMRRVRNLAGSQRPPQIGISLITALPPDREVTLDEAAEIAWQIVYEARKGYKLAVYLVIHDPSLQTPGARNRHSHVFILTREMGPEGLAPTKIRRGIAQVRNGFVAEGIHWPNLTSEVLRTRLLEFGSDIVVDPIAPFPQTHWRPAGHGSNTGRIAFHRAQLMDDNLAAIHGDPAELLRRLLRGGGSLLEIAELRRFISKCIDSRHDQQEAVDLILTHSEVVTFSDTANPERARFVTTAAIHHLIDYAVELVDRARKGAGTIHTAVGADHSAIVAGINALIDDRSLDTEGGHVIIGSRLSDCDDMAQMLAPRNPRVATLKAVLGNSSDEGRSKRQALPAEGLVIVPRAERVGDQDLANLLNLAERCEAIVVLGKDVSVETGVVANRLVCHAVDRLTSPRMISELRVSPERLLRAGLIPAAIKAMEDRLTFQSVEHSASDRDAFDFTVCTNNAAVKVADKALSTAYGRKCVARGKTSIVVELTSGPAVLWPSQPIVFTRTDYAALPPKIREGQVATVFSADDRASTIRTLLSDGQFVSMATRKFPWIRSGFALSIREARQIDDARLRIELGDARHAWAALVLAASQRQQASVVVDPMVARNADALAIVLSGSLPAALPTELELHPDSNAELAVEIAKWSTSVEKIPEPDVPAPVSPPVLVTGSVRELLASDQHAARAFNLLCQLLHPDSGYEEAVAEKLQDNAYRLTMHIVTQLREGYRRAPRMEEEDEFDMPRELALQNPKEWTASDLEQLKLDLSSMMLRGSNLDITSIAAGRGFRRP